MNRIGRTQKRFNFSGPLASLFVAIFARSLNFISSISLYKVLDSVDFLSISWSALLSSMLAMVSGFGTSNFFIKSVFEVNSYHRQSYLKMFLKLCRVWFLSILIFSILGYFLLDNFTYLSLPMFILTLIDAIALTIFSEIVIWYLSASGNLRKLVGINILNTILQAPFRLILVILFQGDPYFWLILGIVLKFLIIIPTLFYIWTDIKNSHVDSNAPFLDTTIFSSRLLFPVFLIGSWLFMNFDKFVAMKEVAPEEAAVFQLASQFASIVSLAIAQIDITFLARQKLAFDENRLTIFLDREFKILLSIGFFIICSNLLFFGFLEGKASQKYNLMLLILSLSHLIYMPIPIFLTISSKIKNQNQTFFFVPYIVFFIQVLIYLVMKDSFFTLERIAFFTFFGFLLNSLFICLIDKKRNYGSLYRALLNRGVFSNIIFFAFFAFILLISTQVTSVSLIISCLLGLALGIYFYILLRRFNFENK